MDMCEYCPFRGHPKIVGASVLTGHKRFCDLLNPNHEDYNPGIEASYREMSAGLNGVTPESAGVLTTKYRKRDRVEPEAIPPGEKIPTTIPKPKPRPKQGAPASQVKMLADEIEHQTVYNSAINCPHRVSVESCCGQRIKCGPGGSLPGFGVSIADCYPCTAKRLGFDLE